MSNKPFNQFSGSGDIPGWVFEGKSDRDRARDPAGYRASRDLRQAVNVALALERPLLVTGEPGTGKTDLAGRIAAELKRGKVLRFDTKSSSVASDLFYRFDTVRHFAQAQLNALSLKPLPEARDFLHLQALGEAIVMTREPGEVRQWLGKAPHDQARASVVLIDELDKAPRDFPNDLLNQIENLEFDIPELPNCRFEVNREFAPFILITSNSERQLPEAFLRRCVYHHIEFPTEVELPRILASRLGGMDPQSELFKSLLTLFYEIRKDVDIIKKPSTSELLDWLRALNRLDLNKLLPWQQQAESVRDCLGSLLKNEEDLRRWGDQVFRKDPATEG